MADAESAAAKAVEDSKANKIVEAEERLRIAESSNNAAEILAASSALSALEAQAVTGMSTVSGGGRAWWSRARCYLIKFHIFCCEALRLIMSCGN